MTMTELKIHILSSDSSQCGKSAFPNLIADHIADGIATATGRPNSAVSARGTAAVA